MGGADEEVEESRPRTPSPTRTPTSVPYASPPPTVRSLPADFRRSTSMSPLPMVGFRRWSALPPGSLPDTPGVSPVLSASVSPPSSISYLSSPPTVEFWPPPEDQTKTSPCGTPPFLSSPMCSSVVSHHNDGLNPSDEAELVPVLSRAVERLSLDLGDAREEKKCVHWDSAEEGEATPPAVPADMPPPRPVSLPMKRQYSSGVLALLDRLPADAATEDRGHEEPDLTILPPPPPSGAGERRGRLFPLPQIPPGTSPPGLGSFGQDPASSPHTLQGLQQPLPETFETLPLPSPDDLGTQAMWFSSSHPPAAHYLPPSPHDAQRSRDASHTYLRETLASYPTNDTYDSLHVTPAHNFGVSPTSGRVTFARSRKTGEVVALRRLTRDEREYSSAWALREWRLMEMLKGPHIVSMKEALVTASRNAVGRDSFRDVFAVLEHVPRDLASLLSSPDILFMQHHIKCLMLQTLEALDHCHRHGVVHRNIEASQLLIDDMGVLKIASIDRALVATDAHPLPFASPLHVRPPEVLLGCPVVMETTATDIWALGCVFAHLLLRHPLFMASSEKDMILQIFRMLGTPTGTTWAEVENLPLYSKYKRKHFTAHIHSIIGDVPPEGRELLLSMLALDPRQRPSAAQAICHPYFATDPHPCDTSALPRYPAVRIYKSSKASKDSCSDIPSSNPVRSTRLCSDSPKRFKDVMGQPAAVVGPLPPDHGGNVLPITSPLVASFLSSFDASNLFTPDDPSPLPLPSSISTPSESKPVAPPLEHTINEFEESLRGFERSRTSDSSRRKAVSRMKRLLTQVKNAISSERAKPVEVHPPSPSHDLNNVPRHYICSITLEVFSDPVFADDGYTYERRAIERWFQYNDTSPLTGQPVRSKHLIPNHNLRSQVYEFMERRKQSLRREEGGACPVPSAPVS